MKGLRVGSLARLVAMTAALASGSLALAGCEAVLGLGSESNLSEAGPDGARGDAGHRHDGEAGHDATPDAPMPGAAVVVASGGFSSNWCAVTSSGDVECWGNNESGELGDGTTVFSASPVKVKGLKGPAASVSIGLGTACALMKDGSVFCWGPGPDGELGDGEKTPFSASPVPVSGLDSHVTAISSGFYSACAVKAGAALCWGFGGYALLGNDQMADAVVPAPVKGLDRGVTSVSVGTSAACAVKDGAVLCWGGFDGLGDVGDGTRNGSYTPVPVRGLTSGVVSVSVGGGFACALTEAGGVHCWGNGTLGCLGNGQVAVSLVPVQVKGLESGVSAVSAGSFSAAALRRDGSVVTWGYAADGELGNGERVFHEGVGIGIGGRSSSVPVEVKGLSGPAVSVSTGEAPCVATRTGSVECWGITAENALTPVHVQALDHVTSITAGGGSSAGEFACATSSKLGILCWGGNVSGQLGDGTTLNSAVPVTNLELASGPGKTAVSASASDDFACGIADGIAYCWGDNTYGELGNGKVGSSTVAVGVEGLTSGVTEISAGGSSACAIRRVTPDAGPGGALYCWGNNTYGQLGTGTTTSSRVPVLVPGLASGVVDVALGVASACAVLSDGTAECWGFNQVGQLGDGTTTMRLGPTKVVGITGATAISVGSYSACAVTSGTIQCWGDNVSGTLGNGTFTSSLVPVTVGIAGGASQVSVGTTSACAVVAGGARCWGFGATGNDSWAGVAYSLPVQVTGLTSGVTGVAVGDEFGCAVVDGEVQCWGFNTAGQIGNGGAEDSYVAKAVRGFP
jgi:alpha-tubulin suppressor-like RCC1 family protein